MHDCHEIHGRIYIDRGEQKGKAASIGRWVGRGAKSAKKEIQNYCFKE